MDKNILFSIGKVNRSDFVQSLLLYVTLLFLFWINEISFHANTHYSSQVLSVIFFTLLALVGWVCQLLLLFPIRYNDKLKLVNPLVFLAYLSAVIGVPLLIGSVFVVVGLTIFNDKYIEFNFFFRFVQLSLLANLILDVFMLSKQKLLSDLRANRIELEKSQTALAIFKNQLNPHFLYNCLNSLSYLSLKQPELVPQYSKQFSNLYAEVLIQLGKDWITVQEEIEITKKYFSLEQLRFGDTISVNFPCLTTEECNWQIVPFSIQLLVENAIKHNAYNNADKLVIDIFLQDHQLTVQNAIKLALKPVLSTTSVGLENLQKRYLLIANKSITVDKNENKFSVTIPLKPNL